MKIIKFFTNDGRRKTGLPSHKTLLDEIYLYDNDRYEVFDDGETLKPQISSIEKMFHGRIFILSLQNYVKI